MVWGVFMLRADVVLPESYFKIQAVTHPRFNLIVGGEGIFPKQNYFQDSKHKCHHAATLTSLVKVSMPFRVLYGEMEIAQLAQNLLLAALLKLALNGERVAAW